MMGAPKEILEFLHYHPLSSREEIGQGITFAGRCEEEPSQHLYYIDRGNNFLQRVPLSTLVMFKLVRRKS